MSFNTNIISNGTIGTGKVALSSFPLITKINVVIFSTPGVLTYTPSAGTVYFKVETVGGGSGGGGCSASATGASAGGGGSAGGYDSGIYPIASLQTTGLVTVGSGGAGGLAGNNNGTFGSASDLIANNGAGAILALGSSPNTGGTGDSNHAGNAITSGAGLGGNGLSGNFIQGYGASGQNGMALITVAMGGKGGDSIFGAGGFSSMNSTGASGQGYGSGGAGAACTTNTSYAGGAGASGLVAITEYISG